MLKMDIKTVGCRQDFLKYCDTFCKDFCSENKVLIAYVRCGPLPKYHNIGEEGRRRPQGVVVGYVKNGTPMIGWSLCKKNETFYSKVGIRMSINRSVPLKTARILCTGSPIHGLPVLPHTVRKTVLAVANRMETGEKA